MEIAKYISIVIASMIKFFSGPITGFVTGVDYHKTVYLSIIGMMSSVLLTILFSSFVSRIFANGNKIKKRLFTKTTRFAVKVYQKLGIFGIALLTPPLFMPIGGTLMAQSFKIKTPKLILYMFISSFAWAHLVTWSMFSLSFVSEWLGK